MFFFQSEDWPFQNLCEVLMGDLFHSSWEIRHGAATGLREVIKHHGRGAGKSVDVPSNQVCTSYDLRHVLNLHAITSNGNYDFY